MSNHKNSTYDIEIANQVLAKEIEGLIAIKGILNNNFCKIIDLLMQIKGRIVITGIGKSGLIAKKFAATLASMGTPSMFLHPMEALHGDLGMVTPNDALISFSNSGESAELAKINEYCKRFSILTIAISRKTHSNLVKLCDESIVLPDIDEAVEWSAPTTSTTMMIAISDIIAVVMAKRKGFTKHDFKIFHPGGNIGAQLTKLNDLMHIGDALPLVNIHSQMSEVIIEITTKRFGCAGVVNKEGELVGLITDYDLRKHIDCNYRLTLARDVMNHHPITLTSSTFAAEALGTMNAKKINNCFVVKDSKPIGIIHIHDLLKAKVA